MAHQTCAVKRYKYSRPACLLAKQHSYYMVQGQICCQFDSSGDLQQLS